MASISKNGYIDKLTDIVNEYNNTYYKRIKMKHIDVNLGAYIDLGVKNNDKILILKLVIMWEYQNIKHFCKGLHSKLIWVSFSN